MEEKKTIKLSISILFLMISIIVIAVMGYYIYVISVQKVKAEEEVSQLNEEIMDLKDTTSQLSNKLQAISNTIHSDVDTKNSTNHQEFTEDNGVAEIKLDKEYKNKDYGITFSYPSSFSKHENSLKEDMVESLLDDKGNQIVMIRRSNSTIEDEIDDIVTTRTPDDSIYNTEIKHIGNITLNNGISGYKMEMIAGGDDNIKFLTQKDNEVFIFSFTTENDKNQYFEIFEQIINSIKI